MLAYLKECEDFCLGRRAGEEAKKGEFAVIGTRDMADLIQAALVHSKRVKDAGIELRGPSVVSIYNALDKLRARMVLDPEPIAFAAVHVDAYASVAEGKGAAAGDGRGVPFFPAFVKPRTASCWMTTTRASLRPASLGPL